MARGLRPLSDRLHRCEVFPSIADGEMKFHWRLKAPNYVIIAGSVQGRGYLNERDATTMFESILELRHTDVEIIHLADLQPHNRRIDDL
jgi:uncharacterized protein YegP (UPF0339 family)